MKRLPSLAAALALTGLFAAGDARAFCGFYVAKADAQLFNQASQVAMVRDGDRTVLTLSNDFQGDPKEFAVVIPVPTVLQRGQIHVADRALIDHLDAYSAPRLVEYFDDDPCVRRDLEIPFPAAVPAPVEATDMAASAKKMGVKIEATYTVGEYDILILSAKQSDGLTAWLAQNGYRVPPGASPVVASYLKQGMHFFVARVNLKEQAKLGFTYLRPLQMAYESAKFMLPIRLGMVNSKGFQELFVYAVTRRGRVETSNYRTVKLPTGMDVPLFVKNEFAPFYKAMFTRQVAKEDMRAVFLEYAWDMSSCDPCAAEPLANDELKKLGVFWLEGDSGSSGSIFLTRLHVRYDAAHFPEDLVFQETADQESFQGSYVLHHPWNGTASCPAAAAYRRGLRKRSDKEAQTLAALTGWDVNHIRSKMNLKAENAKQANSANDEPWWKRIWKE